MPCMNANHINASTAWSENYGASEDCAVHSAIPAWVSYSSTAPNLPGYITYCGPQCLNTLRTMC